MLVAAFAATFLLPASFAQAPQRLLTRHTRDVVMNGRASRRSASCLPIAFSNSPSCCPSAIRQRSTTAAQRPPQPPEPLVPPVSFGAGVHRPVRTHAGGCRYSRPIRAGQRHDRNPDNSQPHGRGCQSLGGQYSESLPRHHGCLSASDGRIAPSTPSIANQRPLLGVQLWHITGLDDYSPPRPMLRFAPKGTRAYRSDRIGPRWAISWQRYASRLLRRDQR